MSRPRGQGNVAARAIVCAGVAAALAGTLTSCTVAVPPPSPAAPARSTPPAPPTATAPAGTAAARETTVATAPPDTLRRMPVFGPPRRAGGGVAWDPLPLPLPPAARAVSGLEWRAAVDSLAAGPEPLRSWALWRRGRDLLAAADTVGAAASLAAVSPGTPWAWEALRVRSDLAFAAGGAARADSLLEPADRAGWTDLERSAWLLRRVRYRAAAGDTAQSIAFARQLIRRYPSQAPAAQGLRDLETTLAAARDTMSFEDRLAAAEVEAARGERIDAAARLAASLARAPAARKSGVALRRAELLRAGRRFDTGLDAARQAVRLARDPDARARGWLERARLLRDSGRPGAFAAYDSAARATADTSLRSTAAWEKAWELEAAGRWREARAAHAEVASLGGGRVEEAALRVGLLWLVEGRRDQALAAWERAPGERAAFWRAVVRRPSDHAGSDSVLAALAARPGYDFYRLAARETLGVTGWPGTVAAGACTTGACAALDLAANLAALGAADDAHLALQRWSAGETGGDSLAAERWLAASRIAYGIGRVPLAIRFAQRASAVAGTADSSAWAAVAWSFPEAYDSLYRALPDSSLRPPLDRALLRAVAWQESKFDAAARSRSNALGLHQLKVATAGDVARWLGEHRPNEAALLDPARSIRYGARYLEWLLARFDRNPVVAVAAYNSGPGAVSPAWREQIARGGAALFCEMIQRFETRDYVRRVLGARQAYREMTPRTAP